MKTLREIKLTNTNAVHAPWGNSKRAKGLIDEAGIEFEFTREDFKDPVGFDMIFEGRKTVIGWAICSRVTSKLGCEVNNRWIFVGSDSEIESFRQIWINTRDAAGFDHATTVSQANAQQWMSAVMIDALVALPHVPAELLNS